MTNLIKKIYFDNAATSWPKPDCVVQAVTDFTQNIGSNPGRSGHSASVKSGRIVYAARESIARLFNFADPLRVIFTSNITEALNLALKGLLKSGDHVITSSMEHNSMMRPMRQLEKHGIEMTVVNCEQNGCLDPADLSRSVKSTTKMIALNHASNVTGTLLLSLIHI